MSQDLQNALRGEALAGLKTHNGYMVLINEIIYPLYADALSALEEKENWEARAMIKAIKTILAQIDDTINLGKQAREEFKNELAKHIQVTSEYERT